MRRDLLFIVFLSMSAARGMAVEQPDANFDTNVARPAYTTQHPAVLVDGNHNNYWAAANTYKRLKPFADLIVSDGYRIIPNRQKFSKAVLSPYSVLVTAGAMGGPRRAEPSAANPAFTRAECDAVREWVEGGGALLLMTDRHPFGAASRDLARRFGVEVSNGLTCDPDHSTTSESNLLFSRENGLLLDHPITRGRDASEQLNQVASFGGQSLKGPAGSVPFLQLAGTAVDRSIDGEAGQEQPAQGRAQGIALTVGKGRVVVVGDAAMLTALVDSESQAPAGMNVPGNDDRQLALNIMHWLSGVQSADTPVASASTGAGTTKPASSPGETKGSQDVAERSAVSVALIKGEGVAGTGFLIKTGVLVTSARLIAGEFISGLEAVFPSADDARDGPFPVELLYEDTKHDIALLAVKSDLPALKVSLSSTLRKGEDVMVIGNPGAGGNLVLENAVSKGIMSTKVILNGMSLHQLSIAISQGSLGGPVLDSSGQVVGMATLKSANQESIAFSVPADDLREAVEKQARQTLGETNKLRSQHRAAIAAKSLGTIGVIYFIGIDLRRAGSRAREASAQVDALIAGIEKEALPTLAPQVTSVRKDTLIAPSARDKLGRMADSFGKLKTAYAGNTKSIPKADLLRMKAYYKQLMTDLYGVFKLELPTALMTAFEDNPVPTSAAVTNIVPSQPKTSLRDRIQERRSNNSSRRPGGSLRDRRNSR